jgi:hypothetical protein
MRPRAGFLPGKIVSGGQTGVDRAALDAAVEAGLPCGGWVPKGRRAEDGRIPDRYPLRECASRDYPARTELNVKDSDATLILNRGVLRGGTSLTDWLCRKHKRPYCLVQLDRLRLEEAADLIKEFLEADKPEVLNVAGPRESGSPGIYAESLKLLRRVLAGVL